jgi:hypothetical protein
MSFSNSNLIEAFANIKFQELLYSLESIYKLLYK